MEGSTKLYRIYKTITKMLDDRGYLLSQKELNRTIEQVRAASYSAAPDSPPQSSFVVAAIPCIRVLRRPR